MNAKENALRILRFDRPERVVQGPPKADCSYFGVNHEPFAGVGGHDSPIGTQWCDIWGVGWRKELDGVMGFAVKHPVDLACLDRFGPPDPDDERICSQVYRRAETIDRAGRFLTGSHRETLWERCYNLAGMDRLMMGFIDAPEAVRELLARVMDFQLGIARHYAAVGVEVAGLGDDLGSQRALLFSRGILTEFFVPQYRRLIEFYKRRGVIVTFHSCGHVEPIIDVFVELGVDCLNPVQATANDLDAVRRASAGRMAIQGGVSTHRIMTGPVEAIRAETRRRLWQLGRCETAGKDGEPVRLDGGYFCAPDQGMPFPPAHLSAFEQTLAEFGRYPLPPPDEPG